ncbi:hypothetical protein RCL1_008063 [Eukaryota sp. TZLM3-RCL]
MNLLPPLFFFLLFNFSLALNPYCFSFISLFPAVDLILFFFLSFVDSHNMNIFYVFFLSSFVVLPFCLLSSFFHTFTENFEPYPRRSLIIAIGSTFFTVFLTLTTQNLSSFPITSRHLNYFCFRIILGLILQSLFRLVSVISKFDQDIPCCKFISRVYDSTRRQNDCNPKVETDRNQKLFIICPFSYEGLIFLYIELCFAISAVVCAKNVVEFNYLSRLSFMKKLLLFSPFAIPNCVPSSYSFSIKRNDSQNFEQNFGSAPNFLKFLYEKSYLLGRWSLTEPAYLRFLKILAVILIVFPIPLPNWTFSLLVSILFLFCPIVFIYELVTSSFLFLLCFSAIFLPKYLREILKKRKTYVSLFLSILVYQVSNSFDFIQNYCLKFSKVKGILIYLIASRVLLIHYGNVMLSKSAYSSLSSKSREYLGQLFTKFSKNFFIFVFDAIVCILLIFNFSWPIQYFLIFFFCSRLNLFSIISSILLIPLLVFSVLKFFIEIMIRLFSLEIQLFTHFITNTAPTGLNK